MRGNQFVRGESVQSLRISRCRVGRTHAKNAFFGVRGLLRLDGPLSTAFGDISVILGTSGRIYFTKDAFYNFLEVLGKKSKSKSLANRRGTVMVMRRV